MMQKLYVGELLCSYLMKGPEQLPSLKSHANDPAYEVKLQIEMAISRIENGDEH